MRAVPSAASVLREADPLRQAGHRALGPRQRPAQPGDADGRFAGGHGHGRLRARGSARVLGGRADVRPLRGHVPTPDQRAHDPGQLRAPDVGSRLPVGANTRGPGGVDGGVSARLGRSRGARRALAQRRRRRARPPMVGSAPPDGREPGRQPGAPADERRDGRAARAAGDPRADPHPAQHRRSGFPGRCQPVHGTADSGSQVRGATGDAIIWPGAKMRTRSSTRSRSS